MTCRIYGISACPAFRLLDWATQQSDESQEDLIDDLYRNRGTWICAFLETELWIDIFPSVTSEPCDMEQDMASRKIFVFRWEDIGPLPSREKRSILRIPRKSYEHIFLGEIESVGAFGGPSIL